MYGLPLQSVSSWQETLERAVALAPDHISAYGLKLEEGTPLAAAVGAGRLALPPEDEEEAMYDWLNAYLPAQSFARYEISNYATRGQECRHNLKYWRYQPYRGVGVAAHSFDGRNRFANMENVTGYIERLSAGDSPEDFRETSDGPTAMAEFVFLALRTTEGLSEKDFTQKFDKNFSTYYTEPIRRLTLMGLLTQRNSTWRLTERGMKLGNQAFAEFLP